jgi:hypothetical protein
VRVMAIPPRRKGGQEEKSCWLSPLDEARATLSDVEGQD